MMAPTVQLSKLSLKFRKFRLKGGQGFPAGSGRILLRIAFNL